MESTSPSPPHAAAGDRGASLACQCTGDCWDGLASDVIERFMDVTGMTRDITRTGRCGYRADLYALESWIHGVTGHTLVTASTAELWAYFRKAIAAGVEQRLLDRLLVSIQHFYAYTREAGIREDDPAVAMPQWVHKYLMPKSEPADRSLAQVHG